MDFIKSLTFEERESLIDEIQEIQNSERPPVNKPFDGIRKCDPLHLFNILQQEHPQTIAVVLSYFDADKSSIILEKLPKEIKADVVKRICGMDYISPEALREVERVLEKKVTQFDINCVWEKGGVDDAIEIMKIVEQDTKKQIIEILEDESPMLAEEIKNKMSAEMLLKEVKNKESVKKFPRKCFWKKLFCKERCVK